MFYKKFPLHYQLDSVDCGPTCLRMIASYYGKSFSLEKLRSLTFFSKGGVSLLGISSAAESIGFKTLAGQTTFDKILEIKSPFVAHWNYDHFIVVYKVKKNKVYVADPTGGRISYTKDEFLKYWATEDIESQPSGVVLLLEPTNDFYQTENSSKNTYSNGLNYVFVYFSRHWSLVLQLVLSLIAISSIQLVAPFLTQAIVDIGIGQHDLSLIYIILLGQIILFLGRIVIDFYRRWILLHLSARINITLISGFLIKLMKLPLAFFDSKQTGDILKRIEDHNRVERFLSTSTLDILFSAFSLIILGVVLLIYNLKIFLVFFGFSIVYLIYVLLFLKKRATLDYKRFTQLANNSSTLIETIGGMAEIKLNNSQNKARRNWEVVQAQLYGLNIESNKLSQIQEAGGLFINELKNILITFLAAGAAVSGNISLGVMLSIQFIIGQLNVPINGIISIIREWQDAKLSMERIGEITKLNDEDTENVTYHKVVETEDIHIENLSFQYEDKGSPLVLSNINFTIPKGKITAIVGTSGSGKTTLLKLLLKYFPVREGRIILGTVPLEETNSQSWRNKCGVVMQENFVFSDTILNNVTLSSDKPDFERFHNAIRIAHIGDFIESLPMGYNTKIGKDGVGISSGQKQRLLIARAVYKNPEFIILDEATSALDANNEKTIVQNLSEFFMGKTVLIVAHRLSTVRNAHQIVVLEEGKLAEVGDHLSLIKLRGKYFELIQNQLEL